MGKKLQVTFLLLKKINTLLIEPLLLWVMKNINYRLLYNRQIFIAEFKTDSIKFGSILYVTTSEDKVITGISNKKSNRSIPTGVIWVSGNNAELSDGVIIKEEEILSLIHISEPTRPY